MLKVIVRPIGDVLQPAYAETKTCYCSGCNAKATHAVGVKEGTWYSCSEHIEDTANRVSIPMGASKIHGYRLTCTVFGQTIKGKFCSTFQEAVDRTNELMEVSKRAGLNAEYGYERDMCVDIEYRSLAEGT